MIFTSRCASSQDPRSAKCVKKMTATGPACAGSHACLRHNALSIIVSSCKLQPNRIVSDVQPGTDPLGLLAGPSLH